MKPILSWCDRHLIDNWRTEWKRLWSIRLSIFWISVAGVVALTPMVSDEAKSLLGPLPFAIIFFMAFVSVGVARYLKQPGAAE